MCVCECIGLGTYKAPPGEVAKVVATALRNGYRHLGTAPPSTFMFISQLQAIDDVASFIFKQSRLCWNIWQWARDWPCTEGGFWSRSNYKVSGFKVGPLFMSSTVLLHFLNLMYLLSIDQLERNCLWPAKCSISTTLLKGSCLHAVIPLRTCSCPTWYIYLMFHYLSKSWGALTQTLNGSGLVFDSLASQVRRWRDCIANDGRKQRLESTDQGWIRIPWNLESHVRCLSAHSCLIILCSNSFWCPF